MNVPILSGRRAAQLSLALASAVWFAAAPAARADQLFSMDTFTLADGATASGTLSFNESTQTITDWSMDVTGAAAYDFTPSDSDVLYAASGTDAAFIYFLAPSSSDVTERLTLALADNLDDVADDVLLGNDSEYTQIATYLEGDYPGDGTGDGYYGGTGSTVLSQLDPVPEPSTLAILGAAIGIFLLSRRTSPRVGA